eukprot:SAG25_NODE_97_length_15788_cov_5.361910_14_plen_125_part_00
MAGAGIRHAGVPDGAAAASSLPLAPRWDCVPTCVAADGRCCCPRQVGIWGYLLFSGSVCASIAESFESHGSSSTQLTMIQLLIILSLGAGFPTGVRFSASLLNLRVGLIPTCGLARRLICSVCG